MCAGKKGTLSPASVNAKRHVKSRTSPVLKGARPLLTSGRVGTRLPHNVPNRRARIASGAGTLRLVGKPLRRALCFARAPALALPSRALVPLGLCLGLGLWPGGRIAAPRAVWLLSRGRGAVGGLACGVHLDGGEHLSVMPGLGLGGAMEVEAPPRPVAHPHLPTLGQRRLCRPPACTPPAFLPPALVCRLAAFTWAS